jgi:hypothetical protein
LFRTASKLTLCVALLALAVPAIAQASAFDVIKDCQDNSRLDRKHSKADLRNAQKNLPTDINEYGDCSTLIAAALTGGSDKGKGRNGSGGGSHGGSASGASAAAARKHEAAAKAGDIAALAKGGRKGHVNVGGRDVKPGDNGLFNLASAHNGLPLPLMLGLIAAALLAILGGVAVLQRRAPAFASRIPLLSKLSLPRVRLPRLLRR